MAQLTEMSIPMPETIAGSNTVVGNFIERSLTVNCVKRHE